MKAVSTYRGSDPREATLVAFGGNGPVVAADVAAALGIGRVLVPPAAGVFSALGLLKSDIEQEFVRPVFVSEAEAEDDRLPAALAVLENAARTVLGAEGYDLSRAEFRFAGDLRYLGQAYELTVSGPPKPSFRELADAFHREHERTYGHRSATDPVQLVNVRLAVRLPTRRVGRAFRTGGAIRPPRQGGLL